MTTVNHSKSDRVDALFNSLGHVRRRELISIVAAESGPLSFDAVVERIAARDSDTRVTADGGSVADVSVDIFHSHLPRLQEAGIIECSDGMDVIERGDRFDAAKAHLELL